MRLISDLWHDIWRVAALLVVAILLMKTSPVVALWLGIPELETYGNLTAFLFGGLAMAHLGRRFLFPRIGLNEYAIDAKENRNVGSGLVVIGLCIVIAALIFSVRPVQAADLPANAIKYLPTLKAQQALLWPDMPAPSVLAAQIEQETCSSLKSKQCWSPHAELKTAREYGFGLGQLTVTKRFNAFAEIRTAHHMQGWSWEDRFDADHQIMALIYKDRDEFRAAAGADTPHDRLAFALSAYNGGRGGLQSDRMTCRATPGCDSGRWFGHVEHTSYKAKLAVKGYGKSFFAINREYVRNVLVVRRPRYLQAMGEA